MTGKSLAVVRWVSARETKNPKVKRFLIVAHLRTKDASLARPDELILHTFDAWKAAFAEETRGAVTYLEWRDTPWGPELTHIAHGDAA